MQLQKTIPQKLFYKIGEVCELVGVETHVLRYWEQEFHQLAPQKNPAGQRVYRQKDVEVALRIKELREKEGFTIAGAKKKLSAEMRGGPKLKLLSMQQPLEFNKHDYEPLTDNSRDFIPATAEPYPLSVVPIVSLLPTSDIPILSYQDELKTEQSIPVSSDIKGTLNKIKLELEELLTILQKN